ncbi:MAG: SAM-dependent methyltransferase, partial [Elusimicrobiota bacterium]|nr:SAM-dependent methyltransferase [Elusimicrobiota bacterium]
KESWRLLKPGGSLIAGIIDQNSDMGREYKTKDSPFYRSASFFSPEEILSLLSSAGFGNFEILQTLFESYKELDHIDRVEKGFGKGSFVAVKAQKSQVE